VPADAPPLFSVVAADDTLCLSGCMEAFQAWQAAGRPAELHIYAEGGHGFGMARRGLPIDSWIDRLADWMGSRDLLPD
jgi:acetyl esterase/lipase